MNTRKMFTNNQSVCKHLLQKSLDFLKTSFRKEFIKKISHYLFKIESVSSINCCISANSANLCVSNAYLASSKTSL